MAFLKKFRSFKAAATDEFYESISPLLVNPQVQKLDVYMQHYNYSRLRHSMDVAYLSFIITKFLKWDCHSTARAGLLHDMFFRGDDEPKTLQHLRTHPLEALDNARHVCELNEVEENIILRHMWLFTLVPPKYKEGYIVTLVDKLCAIREISVSIFTRTIRRSVFDTAPKLLYNFEAL